MSARARRRVLFVIPSLRLGGAERVVALLLRELPRERFELHVGLVEAAGEFLAQVPGDVAVHDLGARRVRRAFGPLVRLARSLRPDVIVPNLGYLNLAILSARWLLPRATAIVPIEHTTLSAEVAEQARPALWRAAYRLLYPRATRLVACSHAIADDLVSSFGLAPGRIRMIRNPIDEPRIEAALASGRSPFPGDGPHVVGVGRLSPVKGYDRLLEAFAQLVGGGVGAELWLVGDGPERAALEARAAALGVAARVHFAGFQPEPYAWMRFANAFVQSSRREGLPVAVLEAAAAGARLVAFDCPGGTREIVSAIPGAQLVADGDLRGLARAIARALGPEPPPRARLPEEFRLARVIEDYAELLENPGR
ncbi:MAG TPA: glycosyltransferase [Myxococcota bacterium]|nr:glycosyltransferase [Myxococcota bacterium]